MRSITNPSSIGKGSNSALHSNLLDSKDSGKKKKTKKKKLAKYNHFYDIKRKATPNYSFEKTKYFLLNLSVIDILIEQEETFRKMKKNTKREIKDYEEHFLGSEDYKKYGLHP